MYDEISQSTIVFLLKLTIQINQVLGQYSSEIRDKEVFMPNEIIQNFPAHISLN